MVYIHFSDFMWAHESFHLVLLAICNGQNVLLSLLKEERICWREICGFPIHFSVLSLSIASVCSKYEKIRTSYGSNGREKSGPSSRSKNRYINNIWTPIKVVISITIAINGPIESDPIKYSMFFVDNRKHLLV